MGRREPPRMTFRARNSARSRSDDRHPRRDLNTKNWLDWFHGDDYTRHSVPVRLPDGRVLATDGRMAIVANVPEFQTAYTPNGYQRCIDSVVEWLAADAVCVSVADATALRQFADAGKPTRSVQECGRCDGKGTVIHVCSCELCDADEEDCEHCDGDGKTTIDDDEPRWGMVCGKTFDRRLIGYLLEHAPGTSTVTIGIVGQMLRIVAAEWTGIVMCGSVSEPPKDMPVFGG